MKNLTEFLTEQLTSKKSDWIISSDGIKYRVVPTPIGEIQAGDVVLIDGKLKTVSKKDIKTDKLMGTSLFGDNYENGHKLVDYCEIYHAR